MRAILLAAPIVLLSPLFAVAQIKPGDKVIVLWEGHGDDQRIPLMSRNETVGWAYYGDVLVAGETNGEWVWIPAKQGYLKRADLIPYVSAIDILSERLRQNPTSNNFRTRGVLWRAKGELDIALGDYNDAIRLDPQYSLAFNNRGILWANKKEYDKALRDYDEAIRLDPKYSLAFNNRGNVWKAKGEYDKALRDYDEAIRLDPKYVNAILMRGFTRSAKKDYDDAIGDYNEVIRLDPKHLNAFLYRGAAWSDRGDFERALRDYDAAHLLDISSPGPLNARAWMKATCPVEAYRDGQQAVADATKACELSGWKEADSFDTLAAAYAEAGDFVKAVEWQRKAIDLAAAGEKTDFQSRLELYESGKPYREQPKGQSANAAAPAPAPPAF